MVRGLPSVPLRVISTYEYAGLQVPFKQILALGSGRLKVMSTEYGSGGGDWGVQLTVKHIPEMYAPRFMAYVEMTVSPPSEFHFQSDCIRHYWDWDGQLSAKKMISWLKLLPEFESGLVLVSRCTP